MKITLLALIAVALVALSARCFAADLRPLGHDPGDDTPYRILLVIDHGEFPCDEQQFLAVWSIARTNSPAKAKKLLATMAGILYGALKTRSLGDPLLPPPKPPIDPITN